MPMRRRSLSLASTVVAVAAVLAACGGEDAGSAPTTLASSMAASDGDSAAPSGSGALRDQRYCEIIPVTRDRVTVTSTVFNTLGLNDCPQETWSKITEEMVNEEFGSMQAKLNGPRHWTMDEIIGSGSSTNTPIVTFGGPDGLAMQQRAVIETKITDDTVGDQYYVPNQVERDTKFVFKAGEAVFELTDPDGHVYLMQSYSQIVDPTLTYDQLAELGGRLQLPGGWAFSTRVLQEDLTLSTAATDGVAYVINDDLLNSYQRAS